MEKKPEDEMKGLEAEIDSAIDRFFVDKGHEMSLNFLEGPGIAEPTQKIAPPLPPRPESLEDQELSFPPLPELSDHFADPLDDERTSFAQSSAPYQESELFLSGPSQISREEKEINEMDISLSPSPDFSQGTFPLPEAFERMETQLLSTEWEITDANLRKTKEAVAASKEDFKGKAEVIHVLGLMEQVLDRTIGKEGEIHPSLVKFLMDAKETVKLLLRPETSWDISIYKQLAYAGIETRFSCLGNEERAKGLERIEEPEVWDRMEGLASRITALEEKMEGMLKNWENHLYSFRSQEAEAKGGPVNVTVCRVGGKLLGVKTDKICKLFKISSGLDARYLSQGKVRLKDLVVRIIDLKKMLSIEEGGENQACRILVVRDKEEYKGFMLDEVIKNLSCCEPPNGKENEYFSGAIHWTYEDRPVEIPILDLNKMESMERADEFTGQHCSQGRP